MEIHTDQGKKTEKLASPGVRLGNWLDLACDGEVSGIEDLELCCLCARGNASAAWSVYFVGAWLGLGSELVLACG